MRPSEARARIKAGAMLVERKQVLDKKIDIEVKEKGRKAQVIISATQT